MRVCLISDSIGMGLMEMRPEPAWRVRFTALRNKDLLAPEYGAMHVAAYLEGAGRPVRVINVVADVHDRAELFTEPNTEPGDETGSAIGRAEMPTASREYLFGSIDEYHPDVILFPLSIYHLALYHRSLVEQIKEAFPESLLVTGGIYSTFHAGEILSDGAADVVVRGEGELTTAELLDSLDDGRGLSGIAGISFRRDGRITHNPSRPPVGNLDVIPHPYTVSDAFNIETRHAILSTVNPADDYIPGSGFLTSRGCPEACTFCLDPAINNGRVRFHSPEYVRDVLAYCSERFGGETGSFFFGDATFTMNKKRMRKILGLIGDLPYTFQIQTRADYLDAETVKNLADSRFTAVAIGAESFNERILGEVARKRLRVEDILSASGAVKDAGMNPVLTFIIGLPGETRESIWRTIDILKENELYTATFFPLVVFRGTALYEDFARSYSEEERDPLRLNPSSEEFLFVNDEFPSPEELTGFTEEANRAVLSLRPQAP